MCEEELHGRALDPPALGHAVEEPSAVVVHHELLGGAGDGVVVLEEGERPPRRDLWKDPALVN